jgi:hypothetical protein
MITLARTTIAIALLVALMPAPAHAIVEGWVELMQTLELLDRSWLRTADRYMTSRPDAWNGVWPQLAQVQSEKKAVADAVCDFDGAAATLCEDTIARHGTISKAALACIRQYGDNPRCGKYMPKAPEVPKQYRGEWCKTNWQTIYKRCKSGELIIDSTDWHNGQDWGCALRTARVSKYGGHVVTGSCNQADIYEGLVMSERWWLGSKGTRLQRLEFECNDPGIKCE